MKILFHFSERYKQVDSSVVKLNKEMGYKYFLPKKKADLLFSESCEFKANHSLNENSDPEKKFETWHVSSPSGFAPRDLKKMVKTLWDTYTQETQRAEHTHEIETKFKLELAVWAEGCQWPNQDFLGFHSFDSAQQILLRIRKTRGFSLQNLAAAVVCLQLEHIDDISTLIKNGDIPASTENLLLKYI